MDVSDRLVYIGFLFDALALSDGLHYDLPRDAQFKVDSYSDPSANAFWEYPLYLAGRFALVG